MLRIEREEELKKLLEVEPSKRTEEQVDTILSILSPLKCFKNVPVDQNYPKECCRTAVLKTHNALDIVSKEDSAVSSWGIMINGEFEVFKSNKENGKYLHPDAANKVKEEVYHDKPFAGIISISTVFEYNLLPFTSNTKKANSTIIFTMQSTVVEFTATYTKPDEDSDWIWNMRIKINEI